MRPAGAHFLKAPETFRARKARKAILSLPASKNGEGHVPETPCTKRTCIHIKNL